MRSRNWRIVIAFCRCAELWGIIVISTDLAMRFCQRYLERPSYSTYSICHGLGDTDLHPAHDERNPSRLNDIRANSDSGLVEEPGLALRRRRLVGNFCDAETVLSYESMSINYVLIFDEYTYDRRQEKHQKCPCSESSLTRRISLRHDI